MLYPAELRARAAIRRLPAVDYQTSAGTASRQPDKPGCPSEAGMPSAVLADIGGRALLAEAAGRAVVERKRAGDNAGAVIVKETDLVGQLPVGMVVVPVVMPAVCRVFVGQGRRDRREGEGCGGEKLQFHLRSPGHPPNLHDFGRSGSIYR